MSLLKACNKVIEYSFYGLFLLVPLAFTDKTSELFEFNKIWVMFGFTVVIGTAWIVKIILQKKFFIQKTPLDIPIILFLISQIISTIFTLDRHISIWGYYSRFNGGLLSIFSYIFLYYAFLSNLSHSGNLVVKRVLLVSFLSGFVVVLWGLPSHFGYDPTCYLFRGTFDVSCWTDAFQPKLRIFSTLGQPNWLAAYLSILIPIVIAFTLINSKFQTLNSKQIQKPNNKNSKNFEYLKFYNLDLFSIWNLGFVSYLLFGILFYMAILYTSSNSGFLGLAGGLFLFFVLLCWYLGKTFLLKLKIPLLLILVSLFLISFIIGTPVTNKVISFFKKPGVMEIKKPDNKKPVIYNNVTDSGELRLIVWKGAIDVWKKNPVFGTGVETFGFAYYKSRPAEHNLTSEWDYLYNKAHNEYLNYLATTGIFGLGSYLLMITWFFRVIFKQFKIQNSKLKIAIQNSKLGDDKPSTLLVFALMASYISILISNFFGFSVVIVNLYFFLIPAFALLLNNQIKFNYSSGESAMQVSRDVKTMNSSLPRSNNGQVGIFQRVAISLIMLISFYLILNLYRFWSADKDYASGSNLNKAGQYQDAYPKLIEAIQKRGDEPVFKDELSINNAVLAVALYNTNDTTTAAKLKQEAINISNNLTRKYPKNIIFWKSRTRLFYTLSQAEPEYIQPALEAIVKASELAPTDAKILYNAGILYGQTGNTDKAIEILEKTVKLKNNYRDAYYALGLFYREKAVDENKKVIHSGMQKKAVEKMKYILSNFSEDDKQAKEALINWGEK